MRIRQWMKHHHQRWRKMRRRGNDQRGRGHRRRETGATGNTGEKSKIRKWEEKKWNSRGQREGEEWEYKWERDRMENRGNMRGLRKCKRKDERRQECWFVLRPEARTASFNPAGVSPDCLHLPDLKVCKHTHARFCFWSNCIRSNVVFEDTDDRWRRIKPLHHTNTF